MARKNDVGCGIYALVILLFGLWGAMGNIANDTTNPLVGIAAFIGCIIIGGFFIIGRDSK